MGDVIKFPSKDPEGVKRADTINELVRDASTDMVSGIMIWTDSDGQQYVTYGGQDVDADELDEMLDLGRSVLYQEFDLE